MRIEISRNSHFGTGLLIIELILTMYLFNQNMELKHFSPWMLNFWTSLHSAIHLVIYIVFFLGMIYIFIRSKIGGIIVSLFYSVMWTMLLVYFIHNF
ncbi:hypothetical protein CLPUN_14120 [Clostridium puniceum]|uniref:Uncharacterized protein n=1 Tax=Clostridium puniceum TaxID=29367 RepID=A0A1S8TQQ7_9CLOT|nr:hypothetical protein [Clostridium puniceum]OOM79994.1 hypothetical protein CLPUN_14120 [Clostridium puniceum]